MAHFMTHFDHRSGQTLEVDGARLYVERLGDPSRPALVLLHGGFGTLADFDAIAPALAESHHLVGIDSRGHGRSTMGSGPLSYARLQRDVEQLLQQLRLDRPSLLGFSDGGIVAYRVAAAAVVPLAKLATIGATWHPSHLVPLKELFAKVTADSWRAKFPETHEAYQSLNPEPDFDGLAKRSVAMWTDETADGHPGDTLRRIACPVWAARGDDDHLVGLNVLAELPEVIDGVHLLNLPFAGHEAHKDQPEIVTRSLKQFLASASGGSPEKRLIVR